MREHRKKHAELTPIQKKKANCRSYANVYQRRGWLKRQPCIIRGCRALAEKHHWNYDKSLEVTWICKAHHLWLHNLVNMGGSKEVTSG